MKFKLGFKEDKNIIRQARGGRTFKMERVAGESHRDEKDPFTAFLTAPPFFLPLPIPKLREEIFLFGKFNKLLCSLY